MSGVLSPGRTLEGRVVIDLPRGAPARIAFTEPGDIGGLLRGRRPEEALTLVPLVYALCGTAQSQAAVTALEQALGSAPSAQTRAARAALTGMETLREHSLRIALDWPGFLGLPPQAERLRPVMELLPALTAALFGEEAPFALGGEAAPDRVAALKVIGTAEDLLVREIFGEPLEDWRARRGWDGLRAWAEESGCLAGQLLAAVEENGWRDAGAVQATPLTVPAAEDLRAWLKHGGELPLAAGAALPETTPFSRNLDDPLLASLESGGLAARLTARLVELAGLPAVLRALVQEETPPPLHAPRGGGVGFAAVEAARGLLIHAVELRDGAVARYRILAPTRWNFDAAGIAQRSLSRLPAAEAATRRRLAELLVNAVDPCVRHEVRAA
ncbi:nickel-dependent hydrogenase large subunit [Pelagibius marinus]|uniref:nickel-dependent hydrogenase large subunit n=1 Tax=Pelagibius marinus TaxID=2762760 RepID=UPI001872BEF4|nr:nickel-dependent hydrogenase large subunit [Pelagibius marinus]